MAFSDCLFRRAGAARTRGTSISPREDSLMLVKGGVGFQSRARVEARRRELGSPRGLGASGIESGGRRARLGKLTARFRFDDSDNGGKRGRNGGSGVGGIVLNVALTGALAYLTVTGKLGWVFDAIISVWLFFILAPLVALVAYFWFVERGIITGNCPNCGNEFQVFEFAVKDDLQLCPYCSQPFKVDNKVFVRDGPRYNARQTRQSSQTSYSNFNERNSFDETLDTDGVIVDVEAEVLDD